MLIPQLETKHKNVNLKKLRLDFAELMCLVTITCSKVEFF